MKSYHLFEVKGVNQERFFNKLSKKTAIFDVVRKEKTLCSFKVPYRDAKKARAEILSANMTILSEKSGGLAFYFSKLFCSYGIILATVVCSVLYFFQSNFVEKIEVWGDCDRTKIQQFVAQNLPSKNKNKIDCDEIEMMISSQFDELSFVSAAIVGQSLIINAKSAIIPSEMTESFAPIVAQFDGIVREINLIQGTLAVSPGDIIQKGQILVEGRVINSEGESMNIEPKAEILMDVWAEGESVHYDEMMLTTRTGKVCTRVSVSLFGQEFYSRGEQPNFAECEEESSTAFLSKNLLLPFVVTTTKFFETKTELVESEFVLEEQIALARENCLQNLSEYEIIKEENYRIIEGPGCTTVKYVVTASQVVKG